MLPKIRKAPPIAPGIWGKEIGQDYSRLYEDLERAYEKDNPHVWLQGHGFAITQDLEEKIEKKYPALKDPAVYPGFDLAVWN